MKLQLRQPAGGIDGGIKRQRWSASLKMSAEEAADLVGGVQVGKVQVHMNQNGSLTCRLKLKTKLPPSKNKKHTPTNHITTNQECSDKAVVKIQNVRQKNIQQSEKTWNSSNNNSSNIPYLKNSFDSFRIGSPDSVLDNNQAFLLQQKINNNKKIANFQYLTQQCNDINNQIDKSQDLESKLNNIIKNYDQRVEKLTKNIEVDNKHVENNPQNVENAGNLNNPIQTTKCTKNLRVTNCRQKVRKISENIECEQNFERSQSQMRRSRSAPSRIQKNCRQRDNVECQGPVVVPDIDCVWKKPTIVLIPW